MKPKPYAYDARVRLPAAMHAKLTKEAEENQRSLSRHIRFLILELEELKAEKLKEEKQKTVTR